MNTTTKSKPIIFSGPMVRAIIDGRKTQTRRVVKPQPSIEFDRDPPVYAFQSGVWCHPCAPQTEWIFEEPQCEWWRCPYGVPGDLLYVRESVMPFGDHPDPGSGASASGFFYRADYFDFEWADMARKAGERWRPSIHMPRWASRLTLEVVSVRVERVQEISKEDAIAEGWPYWRSCAACNGALAAQHMMPHLQEEHKNHPTPSEWFHALWDSINAAKGFGWDPNPYVWAVEVKVAEART